MTRPLIMLGIAFFSCAQLPAGEDASVTLPRVLDMRAHGDQLASEAPELFELPALIEPSLSMPMVRATVSAITGANLPCSSIKFIMEKADGAYLLVSCDHQTHTYAVRTQRNGFDVIDLSGDRQVRSEPAPGSSVSTRAG